MFIRRFVLFPLALAFLALVCPVSPTFAATAHAKSVPSSHVSAPSDAQLDATIRAKLAKSKIGRDGFKFHVQHGVVTWEGSTNVMQHKGSATRMAHAAGATQVVNNIQVSAAAKAKSAANLKRANVIQ
jgi:hypothetical protein